MKILVLASWYPNEKSRVMGTFVKEQADALKASGTDVVVFFPFDSSVEAGKMKEFTEDGVKVYRANTDYLKNSKLSTINSLIKSLGFLNRIYKAEKFQLVHAHVTYTAGFIADMFFRKTGIPYVITEHMSTVGEFMKRGYNKFLYKRAFRNSKKVLCVSNALLNELKSLGLEFNGAVVPNIVDENKFSFSKKESSDGEVTILFIGSMDSSGVKGLDSFIPALGEYIYEKGKQVKLDLVGDGPRRGEYEKLASEKLPQGSFRFLGTKTKGEINDLMVKCDFLVLPSRKETFGCVLIEAMASGRPVLATACGGPQDIVTEKTGILAENQSKEELKKSLDKIISKLENYDYMEIRKYAVENYGISAIGSKLNEIYKEVTGL